jgi:hypothetical protein
MSRRCSVRFCMQHFSFVRSFPVSLQAPSFVRCSCTPTFCIIRVLHTRTREPHIHPHAPTYVFCNSSPFLHISASCSSHLPLCVLDTHARVAPLYFRLSQNNLPSSSPSSSSFCTRLHRWPWIPTISACLCTQKDRFVIEVCDGR